MNEHQKLAIEALDNAKGDDTARARAAFRGLSDEAMQEQHGMSGKTRAEILADVDTSTFRITLPLEMIWQPKEDITTYELAMCLPYFLRHHGVMPYEVDKSLPHFRHFKIINHNAQ